ncbi:APC family permease [Paraburkholderia sp. Tr-20389]|uniref:APC family permease n=1 Tax=Paraburkholderia sp. Tr-20389 TaxID=2703903 RepID=UPI00197EB600|nr:APC family permease [Paraburkholderia sp. Tr-20389]MBN3754337.1 APC family permease [Paraburkholderia sp. Tr-20389]
MSTDSFGYKQELQRSLTFADLVIYGIVFMIPIAPFAIYGYVSDASGGMVPLAYIIGMVAMFFTALSYKVLSEDFPIAGSAYAYAQRGIGETAGFIAGWMLILDYLLIPALTYVVAAAALSQMFEMIPRWVWIVVFLGIGTITNYFGVQATAAVNKFFMYAQMIVLVIFSFVGLWALYHGVGAGHLTLKPLFQPEVFKSELVFSAVSVCALSFLGFDAISTLAEEVKGDSKKTVGNATIAALLLAGALFVLQTWIAGDLANGMKFKSADTAFYEIAELAGGKPLAMLTSLATAITFGLSCSIVSQAAIARLLYSMARDRKMPAILASIHPKHKTPNVALILIAVISMAISLGFLDHLDTLTNFVNFGALTGFMILHITVVVHYVGRKHSRSLFKHLVSPVVGFCILGYVLYSMGAATWELGVSWFGVGVVYYFVLTRVLRRDIRLEV